MNANCRIICSSPDRNNWAEIIVRKKIRCRHRAISLFVYSSIGRWRRYDSLTHTRNLKSSHSNISKFQVYEEFQQFFCALEKHKIFRENSTSQFSSLFHSVVHSAESCDECLVYGAHREKNTVPTIILEISFVSARFSLSRSTRCGIRFTKIQLSIVSFVIPFSITWWNLNNLQRTDGELITDQSSVDGSSTRLSRTESSSTRTENEQKLWNSTLCERFYSVISHINQNVI